MRMLTKAEACKELKLSLSTLNRRIAAGEVTVQREPRGRRHRVYVMLDDDPPAENGHRADTAEPNFARERIRELEKQVTSLQEQLDQEQQRNAGLARELKAAPAQRGPWWRFWQRYGDRRALDRASWTCDDVS